MVRIDKQDVYKNVIKWVCKTDGYDGAIGGITTNLPCPFNDYNMHDLCLKYNTAMDEVIGSRPEIDVNEILFGNHDEYVKLHDFAKKLTEKIVKTHEEFTRGFKFKGIVKTQIGIDKYGFVRYEMKNSIYGNTKHEVIVKMLDSLGWNGADYDWVHDCLQNEYKVCSLKDVYLQVIPTFGKNLLTVDKKMP